MDNQVAEILEIAGRLDERTQAIQTDVQQIGERLNSHSKRLSSLEKGRARLYGMGAAVAVLAGWAGLDSVAKFFRDG